MFLNNYLECLPLYMTTHRSCQIDITCLICWFKRKVTDFSRFICSKMEHNTEYEPHHEKTNILHMRKQKRRSSSQYLRSWSAPPIVTYAALSFDFSMPFHLTPTISVFVIENFSEENFKTGHGHDGIKGKYLLYFMIINLQPLDNRFTSKPTPHKTPQYTYGLRTLFSIQYYWQFVRT